MAGETENWRLILDAARALTATGQAPFTRIGVYEWIWRRHPRSSHDRPSLDPTFQGMVRNATGGPKSRAGTPLLRVDRGRYVLADANSATGESHAAPREQAGSRFRPIAAGRFAEDDVRQGAKEVREAAVIEVAIGRAGAPGVFRVDLLRSAAGEASTVTALDAEGLLARRAELQRAVLASAVPVRRVLEDTEVCLRDAGKALFGALLGGGDVAARYQAAAAIAAAGGQLVRVIIRIDDPVLAGLPWEAMYDHTAGEYVCRRAQVVRHVPVAAPIPPLAVEPPLRILAVASSPRGFPPLDVGREQEQLDRALTSLARAGLAEVRWAASAAWPDLQDMLLAGEWHVVHFIGHGDFDPDRDEGVLALVGADGRADLVEASRLVDLLRQASPMPRLVVLNSCAGAASGPADLFSGTAAALVRGGVSAVAAMQYEISDPAAVAFCRGFYAAIARGRGVDEAVSSGRVAILGLSGRTLEWVTPVLYLRGRDSRLFTMPKPSLAGPTLHKSRAAGQGSPLALTPANHGTGGKWHAAPGGAPADSQPAKPRYTNCVVCGWPFSTPGGQARPNCQEPGACATRINSGWLPGIGDPRDPHNLGAVTADDARASQATALANGMLPPEFVAFLLESTSDLSRVAKMTWKTEGAPSSDRDDLERITIRPTRMKKSLADVNGNGFVAEQFYTPYTLRNHDGTRKYYLFSGARRDIGTRLVAMHAHGGWRGDWVVLDPAKITSSLWEWTVTHSDGRGSH